MESVVTRAITREERLMDLTTLVTEVRNLNRLETASMRVVHVATITQTYQMVPDALGGDQITFLAAGDVIAGVDMSLFKQSDVRSEADGTVVLRLPPAQVLVTRVDNRESHVIARKTGLFRRADMNLESRVRQHAEQEIRNEALRKGILNLASQNAQARIAEFVHTLGFTKVRFDEARATLPAR
ncbi:MAG TPA: DUF4230 domain-containing protein [Thermoanaerobaculia bacterium]